MLRFGMIVLWQYGAVLWSGCFIYGSEEYGVVRWRKPLRHCAAMESSVNGKRRRNKTAQAKAENKKYQNERGIFT